MWLINNANNQVLIEFDGRNYSGPRAKGFIATASFSEIYTSPISSSVSYPFDNESEGYEAAIAYLRDTGHSIGDTVPPDDYELPDPDVAY